MKAQRTTHTKDPKSWHSSLCRTATPVWHHRSNLIDNASLWQGLVLPTRSAEGRGRGPCCCRARPGPASGRPRCAGRVYGRTREPKSRTSANPRRSRPGEGSRGGTRPRRPEWRSGRRSAAKPTVKHLYSFRLLTIEVRVTIAPHGSNVESRPNLNHL